MAAVTTSAGSTPTTSPPGGDAETPNTFPLMRFCAELRIMIWQAAMPDFAPCQFGLHCESDHDERTLTLVPDRATKTRRTPIAALSAACHESRQEMLRMYPDLLPLYGGHVMRFNCSEDVVMLKERGTNWPHAPFQIASSNFARSIAGTHFPFGWNAQVQNIAFERCHAMQSVRHARELLECAMMREHVVAYAKYYLNFLGLFPSLRNYHTICLAVYASEKLEAARKDCQQASVHTYVEHECASPEDITLPDHQIDWFEGFRIWRRSMDQDIALLLGQQAEWAAGLELIMQHIMRPHPHHDSDDRSLVTRLHGVNYSTIIGFCVCHATYEEVAKMGSKRMHEVLARDRR